MRATREGGQDKGMAEPTIRPDPNAGLKPRGFPRQGLPTCPAWRNWSLAVVLCLYAGGITGFAQDAVVQISFRVKYVTAGALYLDGGRAAGLAEGQRLTVRGEGLDTAGKPLKGTAEIRIVSVASSSAAAEIIASNLDVRPGDTAYLSAEDVEKLRRLQTANESRKYPQVITFSEGDPMEEEAREHVPRPPLPEVNRARGRIGLEYNSIRETGSGMASNQLGFVLRVDMTRLGGTYWNLSGYYRGRLNSRSLGYDQQTLTDLINRTYHLSLTYDNPGSRWVAGFGRLYLPWATSLNSIDGGYLGRRVGKGTTFGLFGGSAPDPTSWNYDPNRQLGGGFVNFDGGSFDAFRYTTTVGLALSRVDWHPDRQFGFMENGFFFKHYLSIYHNIEADLLRGTNQNHDESGTTENGPVLSRDYLTVRIQPHRVISFDVSENYFREIPTFDARLVSTGLLDRYLFQGLSGGVRLELPYHLGLYTSLGRSHKSGDEQNSWNQMYGITFGRIWRTGIRADARYSKFDSSFGSGTYRSLMFSRDLGESLRFEVQAGEQQIVSAMTDQNRARWITSNFEWFASLHYFLGSGFTIYRGQIQSYDQWYLNLGYRF